VKLDEDPTEEREIKNPLVWASAFRYYISDKIK
jgi:hypothetical protein